ncbi:Arylsulfotransferase (ASST) [Planctomycetes bacterium Pla163]|uniref:Arylsulfotransferase (ASST) n=1 Tax=Rohdeia mirabilis TaxID=2528008 RepID=A0A518CXG8_9BACT|nr:Arylsulfotransferase (ASST) [Planctomycetes bacterium Pla163]
MLHLTASLLGLPFLVGTPVLAATQEPAPPRPGAERPVTEARPDDGRVGTLALRTAAAYDGYTLVSPLQSTSTFLLDLDGRAVHRWECGVPPGNSAYLLDDGRLLRTGRVSNDHMGGGGQGGRIQEWTWDGDLVWDYELSSERYLAHHDIAPLANGNVLAIAWERLDADRARALGRDPEHVTEEDGFWVDVVLELKPDGLDGAEVVWKWSSADHLVQDLHPELEGYGDVPANVGRIDVNADHRRDRPLTAEERERARLQRERMEALGYIDTSLDGNAERDTGGDHDGGMGGDWLHTNSIDHHPELDLILLSVRSLGEVWVIDHSTTADEARGSSGGRFGRGGELLFRWGNPRVHGHGTDADRQLFGQHDARWIEGAVVDEESGARDLRMLVFNNGSGRPDGSYATVEELVLPFDPTTGFEREDGEPFEPEEPAWIFGAREDQRFEADFISGAQRLPNGSTLVCAGPTGRLFEVDREGRVLWDFTSALGGDAPTGRPGRGQGRRGPGGGPPRGGPPNGGPPDGGPPRGAPPGRDGQDRGGPGGGGPGGMGTGALFRGTRLAADHPAFVGRELAPIEVELPRPNAGPQGRPEPNDGGPPPRPVPPDVPPSAGDGADASGGA